MPRILIVKLLAFVAITTTVVSLLVNYFFPPKPPITIAPSSTITLVEDTKIIITLIGTDADGDAVDLIYKIVAKPDNGTVTLDDNIATYIPATNYYGSDNFAFIVTDGENGLTSEPAIVNIKVLSVNDAPIALPLSITLSRDKKATTK